MKNAKRWIIIAAVLTVLGAGGAIAGCTSAKTCSYQSAAIGSEYVETITDGGNSFLSGCSQLING